MHHRGRHCQCDHTHYDHLDHKPFRVGAVEYQVVQEYEPDNQRKEAKGRIEPHTQAQGGSRVAEVSYRPLRTARRVRYATRAVKKGAVIPCIPMRLQLMSHLITAIRSEATNAR